MQNALTSVGIKAAITAVVNGREAATAVLREAASELFEGYALKHPVKAIRLISLSKKMVVDVTVDDLKSVFGEFLEHQDDSSLVALLAVMKREAFYGESVREFILSGRLIGLLTMVREHGPDYEIEQVSLTHLEGIIP